MRPDIDRDTWNLGRQPQLENKVNDYVYRVAKSLKSFSRKNAGELFYIYCQEYNGNSVIPQPLSLWKGTFSSTPDKGRLSLFRRKAGDSPLPYGRPLPRYPQAAGRWAVCPQKRRLPAHGARGLSRVRPLPAAL